MTDLNFDWMFNDTAEKAAAVKAGPPASPEIERAQQVYNSHQQATQKSEALQIEILKGLREGQDTASLLLTACECIAAITGNKVFCKQAETYLKKRRGSQGKHG